MIGCWSYYDCHKIKDGIGTSPSSPFSDKKAKFPYSAVRPSTLSEILLDRVQFLSACIRSWLHTKPHISSNNISPFSAVVVLSLCCYFSCGS